MDSQQKQQQIQKNYQSIENNQKKSKKKSGGFESFNLIYPIYKAIKAKGFNVPTPIQRKAIPLALEGRDVVACSRTGSGKTAAFIIPLINRLKEHSKIVGVRALIILPTRELALQTAQVLKAFTKFSDITFSLIVGGHNLEGQFESLATNPDIIIATPGRLVQHISEANLTFNKVEILIIDEADYMFEMGFAEQMKAILQRMPLNRQTLMFSATIPEELSKFAKAGLKDYIFVKLDQEYTLSDNILLNFIICRTNEKVSTLLFLLQQTIPENQTSIVFVPTKYHVDHLIAVFEHFKIKSIGIYGKMDQVARKDQINEFKAKKCRVMIVTDLAARGIDIPFIDNVIHYDFPAQPKNFIHRSGRTARAGRIGNTYSLISITEVMYISEILLFIGRTLSTSPEDLKNRDNSKAYYGKVPIELTNNFQEALTKLYEQDIELSRLQETANLAFQKFKKTRQTASKASVYNSQAIDLQIINPIFEEQQRQQSDSQNYIEALKNYKPKESYLDILKQKQLKKFKLSDLEEDKLQKYQVQSNQYFQAISNMKSIEQSFRKKKDKKLQAKANKTSQIDNQDNDLEKIEQDNSISDDLINYKNTNINQQRDDIQILNNSKLDKKKSRINDFRHPTQFISNTPDMHKKNLIEDDTKITMQDINPYIIAEDYEDLLNAKKRHVWDKVKKRYVIGKLDETGNIKRDKEDKQFLKNGKNKKGENISQKILQKMKKKRQISFQNEGEQEDQGTVERAKQLFQQRRMSSFGYRFNKQDNKQNYHNVKDELKRPGQLMKSKKIKKQLKLKNMEKGKRKVIINRMKQSKEKHKMNKFHKK